MERIKNLQGQTALITGSSRGIGAAIASELARRGAHVVIHGRHEASVTRMTDAIRRAGGDATATVADVTKWEQLVKMREEVEREAGPISILVANAGGSFSPPAALADISLEDWDTVLTGNLTATFLTLKAFVPMMQERSGGSVVTIASSAGRHVDSRAPLPYGVAKAGIIHLTKTIAQQSGPVRVNCIVPETILTEDNRAHIPVEQQQTMAHMHPLNRLGTPEDIARAVAFLVSDESSWMSGSVIDISGGIILN